MNEALKQNGDREICLSDDDKHLLVELKNLLIPFKELTDLESLEHPRLGLIILIVKEIKDVCTIKENDSETMQLHKSFTLDKVDSRIKVRDVVKVACVLEPSIKNTVKSFFIKEDELKTMLGERALLRLKERQQASN